MFLSWWPITDFSRKIYIPQAVVVTAAVVSCAKCSKDSCSPRENQLGRGHVQLVMFTGDGALNARAVRELRGVMRDPHCRPLQRVLHVLQHVMSDTLRADITQTPVVPLTTACRLSPSFPNGKLQSDPPVDCWTV